MVTFKGGLFCAVGFGTRLDLDAFRAYLESDEVRTAKVVRAHRLKCGREARDLAGRQIMVAIAFFRRCARDPRGFFRDPYFIDRCVIDLTDWTQHFTRQEWPDLYAVRKRLSSLATRTKKQRMAMIEPRAVLRGALPN